MQRYFLFILVLVIALNLSAQKNEIEAIKVQAKAFSDFYVKQDYESMLSIYTKDARIFPDRLGIFQGEELVNYWKPKGEVKWKTTYHKLTPIEIEIFDDTANDYGYFEGISENIETGEKSEWKGKYVVVWKKEKEIWKMYLDIWNSINN